MHVALAAYELGAASGALLKEHGRVGCCAQFAEDLGRIVSEITSLRDAILFAFELNYPPPGPWCESRGPSGYRCTRRPGHAPIPRVKAGPIDHCAGNGDGSIAFYWTTAEEMKP